MTYDHELILVSRTITKDDIGQDIKTEAHKSILCGLKSIGRNEYYEAARAGLKPTKIFNVHSFEYGGELVVKFEGKYFKVIRTYTVSSEETELICEGVD